MEAGDLVSIPLLACISQGQLSLEGAGGGQMVESPFGRSLRDRAVEIYNRNAWKVMGRGGQSLSRALRLPPEADPGAFRIAITSVARGIQPGELLYTLETNEISGVFARDAEGVEKRLFHTADFRAQHLDVHTESGEIALSIAHRGGMANLAVLKQDGSDLMEVTDGESIDQAPRWVPAPGRRLVFQSSGVGRDSIGRIARPGPFTIQQIDLDTNEVSCLASADKFDFVSPRLTADGVLYYIRRPDLNAPKPLNPWMVLLQSVLLPFRVLWGVANFFVWVAAYRAGNFHLPQKDPETPAVKTPSSWRLMRQVTANTEDAEVLAHCVRSFDLLADGSVIYSNGFDVFKIPARGGSPTKIHAGAHIEFIAAL
jgi:hypothetical protein